MSNIDPDKKRPRGRPSTLDTDKTVELAMQAYWHEDPADISLNEICKRTGVSKPALYRAFGNEDGLMRAALARYSEAVLSDILGYLDPAVSLQDALSQLVDFASDAPLMAQGCLFYKMRAGKHRLGPDTRALIDEIDAGAVAAYMHFLQARQSVGDFASSAPVETAARYLSEQVAWALTRRAAGNDPAAIRADLELAFSAVGHR